MRELIIAVQVIAIFVLFFDLMYVCSRSISRAQNHLLILLISTIVMLCGYLWEIMANNAESALAGTAFAYLGKPYAMLATLLFIGEYTGQPISRKVSACLSVFNLIFPILLFTNSWHHLYYSTVNIDVTRTFSCLILGHGPLYYLYMATIAMYFIWSIVLTAKEFKAATSGIDKTISVYLAGIMVASIGGYMLYLTGLTGGYDATMTGAFIGAMLITVLFLRLKIFDSIAMAKDRALENSPTGLLVLNQRGSVEYSNIMANRIMEGSLTLECLKALPDGVFTEADADRVYEISKSDITDDHRNFGKTIELRDVTESHNYSLRLENEVESRTKEIRRIQRSIIASFAGIIDARDTSTGMHIYRMSHYTDLIANSLYKAGDYSDELNADYITCLVDVAPLHDIGKLAIPDSVLLKPGKLTDEEFDLMKTHSSKGADIIRECLDGVETPDYVDMAANVACYHHERWDGTGYPEKLSGEAIPLCARIISVADVYDAVRSERCYKPPMSLEEARSIIIDGCGTQFDPKVVEAFVRALPEIESYVNV